MTLVKVGVYVLGRFKVSCADGYEFTGNGNNGVNTGTGNANALFVVVILLEVGIACNGSEACVITLSIL